MEWFHSIDWLGIAYAIGLLVIGFILAKKISSLVERSIGSRFSRHQAMLAKRVVFYVLLFLFAVSALNQLGFKLTVLLGAAGVFTVALSFASQTAASNLVSGIFLIFESPFKVGDTIKIKDVVGTVESMDLLSTKIQTADNMRIRMPNEAIVKSEITNMSYFKTRRIDITIGISYESDVDEVRKLLLDMAENHANVSQKPAPQVIIQNFGDSAIELKLMAWVATNKYSEVRNQFNNFIQAQVEAQKIDMPYPQITIHQAAE